MSLRKDLIRLASEKPELRQHLLPLLEDEPSSQPLRMRRDYGSRTAMSQDDLERMLRSPDWGKDWKLSQRIEKEIRRRGIRKPEEIRPLLPRRLKEQEAKEIRGFFDLFHADPDYMVPRIDDVEDYPWLYPDMKGWDGYDVSIAYETWDEESVEIGETDERGWEIEDENEEDLEGVARLLERYNWVEWSGHPPRPGDYLISSAEEDYHTGEDTYYHAFVTGPKGRNLTRDEMSWLSDLLYVRM